MPYATSKYRPLKLPFALVLLFFLKTIALSAQVDFPTIEKEIIATYVILKQANKDGDPERERIFSDKLKQQILFALVQDGSYYYSFQKLKFYIEIVESQDKKLRVFSWDALLSGEWRQMVSFAQFRGVENESYVKVLSNNTDHDLDDYRDVCVQAIHRFFDNNSRAYYLLIGYGSHGAGQHHSTVRMFYFGHNELLECDGCFDNIENYLTIKYPKNKPIKITFNPKRRRLSYEAFYLDEKKGSYLNYYRHILWRNGRFRT